jgi:hypothetical protein
MPRTAQAFAHHQPLIEWSTIVRTASSHGQDLSTAAYDQHRFALEVPLDRDAFAKLVEQNSFRKVRTFRWRWFKHGFLQGLDAPSL